MKCTVNVCLDITFNVPGVKAGSTSQDDWTRIVDRWQEIAAQIDLRIPEAEAELIGEVLLDSGPDDFIDRELICD